MIDLRSDTVTRPSDAMRDAAHDADVGDDVYRDDPTVNELEARAADLVGKEAALFVPSGTMGNQAAIRVHTDRGQDVLVDELAHVIRHERGGVAQLSGAGTRTVDCGERAVPTPDRVAEWHHEPALHNAGSGLVCLENTHNARGGVAVPAERIDAVAAAAHDRDVPVHVDGARLFNASVALDTPAARLVGNVDSVLFCLSKGLGAPVGSMLAGSEAFVESARGVRKLFGGGMRQAGVLAGPGLLALDNVERLADDHANARRLTAGLSDVAGLAAATPDTNIVLVDSSDAGLTADAFVAACEEHGVGCGAVDDSTTRFVTHLDVSRSDVAEAVDRVAHAVESASE